MSAKIHIRHRVGPPGRPRTAADPGLRDSSDRSGPIGGFTLIEMIVVIAIIIMTAGFMAPAIATMFQNRKLDNAKSVITSLMMEARNNAVTKKQPYRIVFLRDGLRLYREPKREDPGGFEGGVRSYDPDNTGTIKCELVFAGLEYDRIPEDLYVILDGAGSDPEDWEITPGEDVSIRFLPDGSIDLGGYRDGQEDIRIRREGDPWKLAWIDIDPAGSARSDVREREEGE